MSTITGTIYLINHGKPINQRYNFFVWLVLSAFVYYILITGGFFN